VGLFDIGKSEDNDMSDHYRRLINKTEDYIEANLNHRITLSDVANTVNISEFHFHRLFSKYSTETLKQFITRIKMERSAVFLAVNSEISITEIAFKYGYSSSSNYNKAFKKHYGISPTEFRKEQERKRNGRWPDVQ
jgi:AraC family of transcriptional regulator, multidrug resistance transcriptional activator